MLDLALGVAAPLVDGPVLLIPVLPLGEMSWDSPSVGLGVLSTICKINSKVIMLSYFC